jgi:hypothetical protein
MPNDMSRMAVEASSVDEAPSSEMQNQIFPDVHDHNPAASQNMEAKEDDESTLAYALRHRLTTDYLQRDPYALMREWKQSFHEIHRTLKTPPGSPNPPKEFELKERLVIDMEVAEFLREIMVTPELPEQFEFDQESSNPRTRPKQDDVKVALPLFHSDPEHDTLHDERLPPPDLKKLATTIPFIPEKDEDDENLEYEANLLDQIRCRVKTLEAEKLEIPAETLRFLQTVLRENYDSADEEELVASEIHRPRSVRFEEAAYLPRPRILSPIPFESPSASHVDLVSNGSCQQDLRVTDIQLEKHDSLRSLNKRTVDVMPLVNTKELGLAEDEQESEWIHPVGCSKLV